MGRSTNIKAWKLAKCAKYENTGKTLTADLTTNYDAETNTSLAEKIKNVREHNFEGGANNSQLDKDTEKSNLNSKVILFLLLVIIGFNTCKVRFGTVSYIIRIIDVQAIVSVGLLFAWRCMCLEDTMNTTIYQKKMSIWIMHMNITTLLCQ